VDHELIFSVRVGEDETLAVDSIGSEGFTISRVSDRDPTAVAFLVSFAGSALSELLLSLRRLAGSRSLRLAMKHNGRRLTITTDDEGLDIELLSRVMQDFYRDD
jgi:hypothetical protein